MKLGLFSDPHYSSHEVTCGNRYNSRSLGKISDALEEFRAQGCEMVICLGDLIDREKAHEKEIAHLERIAKVVNEKGMPFVSLMGNHDAFAFEPDEFYRVLGESAFPRTMQFENAAFVFVDACYFASGVHYAPGDDDWMNTYYPYAEALQRELETLKGDVYVFMHQNIDPDIHVSHCLSNAEQMRKALEACGRVKCVIQGHYHKGADNCVNGIRYLTLPAMCENDHALQVLDI